MVRQARFFGGVVRHLGYGTTKWILMLLQDNKTDCLTSALSLAGKPTRKNNGAQTDGFVFIEIFWQREERAGLCHGMTSSAAPYKSGVITITLPVGCVRL